MKEYGVQDLLDLFLQTNDLQQLIDLAAKVLKNPLLICDTSYHFLARSDVEGVTDKSWLDGVKRRSWSYELVSRINRLDLDYTGRKHTTCILEGINPDSTKRRKLGLLSMDGAHMGYYFVLEEWTGFDSVPDETYRQVGAILAKSVCTQRSLQNPDSVGMGERIMLDLLQNGFESRRLFLERAADHELSRLGSYRVLCIPIKKQEHARDAVDARNILSVIGQCLPLSWQVTLSGSLVILADFGTKPYHRDGLPEQFEQFLADHGLIAGLSDLFADPYYLKRYYEQANAAAYLGQLFRDGRRVIPYEEYKICNLFLNVHGEDLFEQYSSEMVRRIYEYDRKNGTEYLNTIFFYLANGCSSQKTADRLYVHRNTVSYRIAKAKALFSLSFSDARQNYLNYFSCLLRKYCDCLNEKAKQETN